MNYEKSQITVLAIQNYEVSCIYEYGPWMLTRKQDFIETHCWNIFNAFFASAFSAKTGPQESQAPEVREEAYKEDDFPLVEEDCVRDRLSDLDVHKSMGPNGMHP